MCAPPPQECGPLDSEAMVMGVLDQSFDVLVLRFGVQKRIYCKVRLVLSEPLRCINVIIALSVTM